MKILATLIMATFVASASLANNAQIVVQKVDNGDIPGDTYRVYVQVLNPTYSVHAVFGDDQNSLSINTTGEFYQNPLGGQTSLDINPQVINLAPDVAYDTWLTMGAMNSAGNNLWHVGIDYSSFDAGSNLSVEDGAWFLVPTDERCTPEGNDLVLIAQLTTTGEASGIINVQGWTADKDAWQERGMTFSTSNAHTFGCMDAAAANYNAEATFNDGSCLFDEVDLEEEDEIIEESDLEATKADDFSWSVFPNPIWQGQFNIQFDQVIDLDQNITIDIIDNAGKMVHSLEVAEGNVIGGNRVIIHQDLAAGMYSINIRNGKVSTTQQVVVQK
ncbi:MAG: T9SS type A sorting domain-containing protein [Flavobacteriales bacterium]|nr:T9SS type A sorting domain-containing protein [Flavobacteriales bacterium]